MLRKRIINLLFISIFLFASVPVQAQGIQNPQPHPDPYSGSLDAYDGRWVIDGMTSENSYWILEINANSNSFLLWHEGEAIDGALKFRPGDKNNNVGDTIEFDFIYDPDIGISFILENMANGLFEVTGQGFVFVREGNKANLSDGEDFEFYPEGKKTGHWIMTKISAIGGPMAFEWSAAEWGFGEDNPLIINLNNGVVSQVSYHAGGTEIMIPFAKYHWTGRTSLFIQNPPQAAECCTGMIGAIHTVDGEEEMTLQGYPGVPELGVAAFFHFKRHVIYTSDGDLGGNAP